MTDAQWKCCPHPLAHEECLDQISYRLVVHPKGTWWILRVDRNGRAWMVERTGIEPTMQKAKTSVEIEFQTIATSTK